MAKQIFTSSGFVQISALINDIRQERLILQPEFQRNLVWNDRHKESFIDTILKGYPFPEIYIAQSGVDFETLTTQQVVVDGQQRLSTILKYVSNELQCRDIPKFDDLNDQDKIDFLGYGVSVISLGNASSEIIKEVFRRINQTKYSLNSIEIQNALYDGEFISTGKEILNEYDSNALPVFSETDVTRMVDLNFILLLMATFEEGGYFSGNSQTEHYIIIYNDEYPNRRCIKEKFIKLLGYIVNLDLPNDTMWFRKSNFFTLFSELVKHDIDNLPADLKARLTNFEDLVMQNKRQDDSEYGRYYSFMYTGTNSRAARITRGNLFQRGVINGETFS